MSALLANNTMCVCVSGNKCWRFLIWFCVGYLPMIGNCEILEYF